jgi:hypothetical protein
VEKAAEMVSEGADRVQFLGSTQPTHRPSQVVSEGAKDVSSSEKSRPIDDEEQARRIAEADLHAGRKQVCWPGRCKFAILG